MQAFEQQPFGCFAVSYLLQCFLLCLASLRVDCTVLSGCELRQALSLACRLSECFEVPCSVAVGICMQSVARAMCIVCLSFLANRAKCKSFSAQRFAPGDHGVGVSLHGCAGFTACRDVLVMLAHMCTCDV